MIAYRSIQHSKYEINNNIRDWIVIVETSCIHFLETLNSKEITIFWTDFQPMCILSHSAAVIM